MAKLENLRVLALEVENVKRIRLVRINPGNGLIEVSGRNKQGKTSLLDAIEMAIGGGKAIPWEPIRQGEETARIVLDLGNDHGLQLRLTRTFRMPDEGGRYKTTLRIEDADGFQPKGAQTLLDSIVDALAFDPEQFIRGNDAEQVAALQALVPGFDFAAADARRRSAFEQRTDERREAKRLQTAADAIEVPQGTPTEAVDTAALIAEMRAVGDKRVEIEEKARGRRQFIQSTEEMEHDAAMLAERAADLRAQADKAEADGKARAAEARQRREGIDSWPLLPDVPDAGRIEIQITEATATNRAVAALANKADLARRAVASADSAQRYTDEIEAIDKRVAEAIGGADFPVSGLSIADGKVRLRGVPFSQGSTAEQLRTSLSIGMALNPRLRVIRIRQGAMFDQEAWDIISQVAAADGFQVWAETINPHDENAIVLVDGEVA